MFCPPINPPYTACAVCKYLAGDKSPYGRKKVDWNLKIFMHNSWDSRSDSRYAEATKSNSLHPHKNYISK